MEILIDIILVVLYLLLAAAVGSVLFALWCQYRNSSN